MSGLPEITVAGNLVADPEMRHTEAGVMVANFRIAANDRRYNQQTGQWENAAATFLRCSIWRQAAQNVMDSLHAGDRVLVTGVLRQSSWETKEGEKRSSYELSVIEIGRSLKFTADLSNKFTRTTVGEQPSTGVPISDPWGSPVPAGAGGGFSDEPPF